MHADEALLSHGTFKVEQCHVHEVPFTCLKIERKTAARQEQTVHAKIIEAVANSQALLGLGMKSMEEMRRQWRSQIKAQSRIVQVEGNTSENVYLVGGNTYDRSLCIVRVFRTAYRLSTAKEVCAVEQIVDR